MPTKAFIAPPAPDRPAPATESAAPGRDYWSARGVLGPRIDPPLLNGLWSYPPGGLHCPDAFVLALQPMDLAEWFEPGQIEELFALHAEYARLKAAGKPFSPGGLVAEGERRRQAAKEAIAAGRPLTEDTLDLPDAVHVDAARKWRLYQQRRGVITGRAIPLVLPVLDRAEKHFEDLLARADADYVQFLAAWHCDNDWRPSRPQQLLHSLLIDVRASRARLAAERRPFNPRWPLRLLRPLILTAPATETSTPIGVKPEAETSLPVGNKPAPAAADPVPSPRRGRHAIPAQT